MPRRSSPAAEQTATAERRDRVAAMYLEGRSQREIARIVRADKGTISRDLAWLREEWLHSALCDFNARKAKELASIDHVEREAWEAWHRSKNPAETVTEKAPAEDPSAGNEPAPPRPTPEVTKKVEGRDGSAEFLRVVQWCVEQRCKILGLDAPQKVMMVGSVKVRVSADPPPALSQDDLDTLADIAVRAGVLGPEPTNGPDE